jgi:hypothetical protein
MNVSDSQMTVLALLLIAGFGRPVAEAIRVVGAAFVWAVVAIYALHRGVELTVLTPWGVARVVPKDEADRNDVPPAFRAPVRSLPPTTQQ